MWTEMHLLVRKESFGGNSRPVEEDGKVYSTASANALADSETGEVIAFGNALRASTGQSQVTFRVCDFRDPEEFFRKYGALDAAQRAKIDLQMRENKGKSNYLIVDFFPSGSFSPRASENIMATKEAYNSNFKRKVTDLD